MGQIQPKDCQFTTHEVRPEKFVKPPGQPLLLRVLPLALLEPWILILCLPHPESLPDYNSGVNSNCF